MSTFFLEWPLWIKLSFILGASLVVTILAGITRNVYVWYTTRNYVRVDTSAIPGQQDVEARLGISSEEVYFGIRALEKGIKVEGVWISRPNSPTQEPQMLPEILDSSASSTISGSITPSMVFSTPPRSPSIAVPQPINTYHLASQNHHFSGTPAILHYPMNTPREIGIDRIENMPRDSGCFPYTPNQTNLLRNSVTLDALEGHSNANPRGIMPRFHSQYRPYSAYSQATSSVRSSTPSLPALTDGVSERDTPISYAHRPPTLSSVVLSESNHRLSHVAETGRIIPRKRFPRYPEPVRIANLDPKTHGSNFYHDNDNHSMKIKIPIGLPPNPQFHTPNFQRPASDRVDFTLQPPPVRSYTSEGNHLPPQEHFSAGVHTHTQLEDLSEYRKVNPTFEVRRHGSKTSSHSLTSERVEIWDEILPLAPEEKNHDAEKRKSGKLQKKRPQSEHRMTLKGKTRMPAF